MIRRSKEKIAYLREQPEEVRWQAATRWSIILLGIITAVAFLILLPLQLYLTR